MRRERDIAVELNSVEGQDAWLLKIVSTETTTEFEAVDSPEKLLKRASKFNALKSVSTVVTGAATVFNVLLGLAIASNLNEPRDTIDNAEVLAWVGTIALLGLATLKSIDIMGKGDSRIKKIESVVGELKKKPENKEDESEIQEGA